MVRLPNNRAANVSFHSAFQLLALEITPGPAQHTDSVIESCRYPFLPISGERISVLPLLTDTWGLKPPGKPQRWAFPRSFENGVSYENKESWRV